MLADVLRSLAGRRFTDADGEAHALELLPPATEAEILSLQTHLPCPIPADVRAALLVSKGLANGPLESFSLVDLEGFGLDELLPCAYSIAHDGFGNYWVLDLLPGSTSWEPVYYVCHDPAVLAYQSVSMEEFLLAVLASGQDGAPSAIDVVHEEVVHRIWRDNPSLLTPGSAVASADAELRAFAATLPQAALIADLRGAKLGDGMSWGRFGPRTEIRRRGDLPIWALLPPTKKVGFFGRLFGGGTA